MGDIEALGILVSLVGMLMLVAGSIGIGIHSILIIMDWSNDIHMMDMVALFGLSFSGYGFLILGGSLLQ